ncbi:hypothetical protein O181_094176 [Austropuccinia psidii MF-1]|uniref:Uncharacterized protein n=1 Tax=Austropuccinia psidii MF-1 TaxID=1389203 RepID=A0A9Q3J2X0_9BASI|nr:hypothetical protein [Austropuccinia psidii MF-1]
MGHFIRKNSDDDQDQREELLVEYQEVEKPEIQDTQLQAGLLPDTANKNLCKHTKYLQTFLVTPSEGIKSIHQTATKMNLSVNNAPHPLIIESGAHGSTVAREYLDKHFPNWEKQLVPTKTKNFKSASGKMTSIGTIIKEIIIAHRKGNIRINPELLVLEDATSKIFYGKRLQKDAWH